MADVHEIKSYKYYSFSSRDAGAPADFVTAAIMLYSSSGYVGAAYFSASDDPLRMAEQTPGAILLYYRYEELPVIVDMLRNESPVYLLFYDTAPINSGISTTMEPVGESE